MAEDEEGASSLRQELMAEDEEGAMSGYLQRARNVLQGLQSLDLKLHIQQCEFLRTKLTKFVDITAFLDDCSTSFALAIGEEVLKVFKRAERLMKECCCSNEQIWLRKAMEVRATSEIRDILCSLADLLPYALSAELGRDPSQCDNQFLDTMKDPASEHTEEIWGPDVKHELISKRIDDSKALLRKVERILEKPEGSELAPDFANMGENTFLALSVRYMYTTSIWWTRPWRPLHRWPLDLLPPEMSSNIDIDSLDVRGARVYTTIQYFGVKYSLLTLNLDCDRSISEELILDLYQEATVWHKYQHAYIVHLMGCWGTKPRPYLLYESINFNLETLLTKVRAVRELKPLEAIEMMLPIARAIKFMHGHEVAHRGLNTENIVCTVGQQDFNMPLHDVTLKLMGFGEALEWTSSSVQERNWKPASMSVFTAPEILLQNNTSIDFLKGDVFSFGMVLLKVLTGQRDFDYLALGGKGSSILQFQLELLNTAGMLPASLRSIIESSCHADPNMRPASEDICSRLLLCKFQLLSQKSADVGSVQAGKIWRLYDIVVPLQALRNWQVLERKKCLPLLAFLAILVAMVSSIVLQSSAVDRALVWISNRIVFRYTLFICVYLYFRAISFVVSKKMLRSELKAQDTRSKQSFQGQSLSKNEQGSFDRLELLMEFIPMMPQLPCLTDIEIVQVMTKAPSDTNKLKCPRTTILQSQFWINMRDSFQIMNRHQCQYLCAKISTMLTNLEDQVDGLPILNHAFKELLGVLDTAKLLVDGCQNFKLSRKAIVLVHCEEHFLEVFWNLHLWMEVVKALQMWKVNDYGGEPLESYMPLLHASEMAKEIVALNEAAAKDHKLYINVLNNYEDSRDLIELNMVCYLWKNMSPVGVVYKSWRPPSFKEDIVLDLTEDLLGVSPTGWVIKTKWAGGYCTLKRVNDAKQFGMQALVLASLRHPHIVQLFNYWEEKGKLFMLMEYMESGDLANFIAKKETLPLPVVIDILLQVARGVYYLHKKGIAHNDLKCPNILMTLDPSREGYYIVKLGGFGSARRVSHNPNVFVQDIYNFGLTCDVIVTQLLSDEYESRFFKLQKIYDSTIQYLRLCIKMCQREDPLLRPNCAKILRLLSLAQLQSMGIIIHTNEFHCLCNMKAFDILKEPVKVSEEETMQESMEEVMEQVMNKEVVEEPMKEHTKEQMKDQPMKDNQDLNSQNTTSSLTSNVNNAQSTPLEKLQSHSDSDQLDPEYPWFLQDTSTTMSSYTDPLLMLLNLSPVATKPGDRTLPFVSHSDMMSMPGLNPSQSDVRSPRWGKSPSPTRFGDVSPLISPLTNTSNWPFSLEGSFCSEGGFCSDDGGDDTIVGAAPRASSPKMKTPNRALDESKEIQSLGDGPRPRSRMGKRVVRETRYTIQTRSDVEVMEDGYKWRKYGQKAVKNSPHPRSYYRCTNQKCPVKKRVERALEDPGLVMTTYEGTHNHLSPAAAATNPLSIVSENSSSVPPSEDHHSSAANFPFEPIPERTQFDLVMQFHQQKDIEAGQDSATATTSGSLSQSPPMGVHIPDSLSRDQPRLSGGAVHGDS